jgi:hypothetical protein
LARLSAEPLAAMDNLTKAEKRKIRELLGEAFEAETAAALEDVEAAIKEWRGGQILPSEVRERIHEFHKESQEIYKTYNYMEPLLAVGRAVAEGFISLENVPESIRGRVKDLAEFVGQNGV